MSQCKRYVLPVLALGYLVCGSAVGAAYAWQSLLPTQQRIRPLGKEVTLGLFPAGMALSADGRLILVTNNGFLYQSLTVVDTETLSAKDAQRAISALGSNVLFVGVALSPGGHVGYASGHLNGADDVVYVVALAPGDPPEITVTDRIRFPDGSFPAGMALSRDARHLYVAANLADSLLVLDTQAKSIVGAVDVGRQPWGVALHPMLPQAYVSNRVDRTLSIVDTEHMEVLATVPTGAGPNAVAVSPSGDKIFVANATSDDLTVFDVNAPESVRTISLTPFPGAQPGSSPNALAFAPDGSRLYVANAWDNDVAVVNPQTEEVEGLIPTGWYPSAVAVSPDNRRLYIANMKGARTFPRTRPVQALDYDVNVRFGGTYGVRGTLQVLPVPSDRMLGFMDRRVRFNNGFNTGVRPSNARPPDGPCFPIPCSPQDPTPIKHVVFIVRENKTYDQELSDLPQGDGVPKFLIYGRAVTPNLHKLVEEFVLLDRFFADSEKSEPGHQWTTAAIDNDYVEKTWTSTSNDGRPDDIGVHADTGYALPVAQPAGLYWFDNCHAHNVSFRIYGEFLRADEDGNPIDYWVANTAPDYARFNLDITDVSRFEVWKQEFDQQVLTDSFPQFTYMTLANDHTKIGVNNPTPQSFVADNDVATGKVIEAISNSPFWESTVIFLVEDDPQSGADHVDSHRTIGTVIGPYVRRGYVSHTRFDMASMHRTMELILGLPPMSQFDQLAIPMRELFTDTPDTTPYSALPSGIPFALTPANFPGAALAARQDWSRPDAVPDAIFNQLLRAYFNSVEPAP
jgi:YVTN family beta-propeller protein